MDTASAILVAGSVLSGLLAVSLAVVVALRGLRSEVARERVAVERLAASSTRQRRPSRYPTPADAYRAATGREPPVATPEVEAWVRMAHEELRRGGDRSVA